MAELRCPHCLRMIYLYPSKRVMEKRGLGVLDILDEVAESFGVTVEELKGPRRRKSVALARQVAMYLIRILLKRSYAEVAQDLGRKDHTTAVHACEKIAAEVEHGGQLATKIEELEVYLRVLLERDPLELV